MSPASGHVNIRHRELTRDTLPGAAASVCGLQALLGFQPAHCSLYHGASQVVRCPFQVPPPFPLLPVGCHCFCVSSLLVEQAKFFLAWATQTWGGICSSYSPLDSDSAVCMESSPKLSRTFLGSWCSGFYSGVASALFFHECSPF